jgi:hypothetical protein
MNGTVSRRMVVKFIHEQGTSGARGTMELVRQQSSASRDQSMAAIEAGKSKTWWDEHQARPRKAAPFLGVDSSVLPSSSRTMMLVRHQSFAPRGPFTGGIEGEDRRHESHFSVRSKLSATTAQPGPAKRHHFSG